MGISRRVASTRRRALRVRARAHAHDRFFRTDRAAARRTNAPIAVGRRFESRRAPFLSHPHACDARRTMVSLNARRNERSSSNKASVIINGFLSSPVRVFYSILFICALEVLLWSVVRPRAVSNGINSAIFFCFYEALRSGLVKAETEREQQRLQEINASNAAMKNSRRAYSGVSVDAVHYSTPSHVGRVTEASMTLALAKKNRKNA